MASLIPASRPNLKLADAYAWLLKSGFKGDGIVLMSIRGYYLAQFGNKHTNDRNVYDDAICVMVIKNGKVTFFRTFNFNTDPSDTKKGMAFVRPGIYKYRKWKHRGKYWALGQNSAVDLDRDGPGGIMSGYYGINIHKGGTTDTWSLGCQTVPMTQWEEFVNLVYKLMAADKAESISYVLTDELERREWKAQQVVNANVAAVPPVLPVAIPDINTPPVHTPALTTVQDIEDVTDPLDIIRLTVDPISIRPVLIVDTVIPPPKVLHTGNRIIGYEITNPILKFFKKLLGLK